MSHTNTKTLITSQSIFLNKDLLIIASLFGFIEAFCFGGTRSGG
jgi:hypothetical protein